MTSNARKLIETAEFCQTLGPQGMDGISAMNLAVDVYEVVPPLVALLEELHGWFENEVEAGDEALALWVEKIDAVLPKEPAEA